MSPVDLLCPSCMQPISESAHFCPSCGMPITSFAVTDPFHSIRAEGEMVRRAMHCPSLLIVIGSCVLFGLPGLCMLALLVLAVVTLLFGIVDGFAGFVEVGTVLIALPTSGFFLLLYSAIVWKVTKRYRPSRNTPSEP